MQAIEVLWALRERLGDAGLTADVVRSGGEPVMMVGSPAFPGVSERVQCMPGGDGLILAWGNRVVIGPAGDLVGAAATITAVFRPVTGQPGARAGR